MVKRIKTTKEKFMFHYRRMYAAVESLPKPLRYSVAVFFVVFGLASVPNPLLPGRLFLGAGVQLLVVKGKKIANFALKQGKRTAQLISRIKARKLGYMAKSTKNQYSKRLFSLLDLNLAR